MSPTDQPKPEIAGVLVHPPITWALTIAVGLALTWLAPLRFPAPDLPLARIGAGIFGLALALTGWASVIMIRAGTNIPTNRPTMAIVRAGPYRFTRNPIYIGMFLGIAGLAVAFDTIWLAIGLAAFFLVIRYGVVAREEAYLERRFGDGYLAYRNRVRRWL